MKNSIEKGLKLLLDNYGVSPENVDVKQSGQYLYAVFDELTQKFLLPFISVDDKSAKKSIFDIAYSEPQSLLWKYQKTLTLWRICDMSYERAGKTNLCPLSTLESIIDNYSSYLVKRDNRQMSLINDGVEKKYCSSLPENESEEELNLPDFINKE